MKRAFFFMQDAIISVMENEARSNRSLWPENDDPVIEPVCLEQKRIVVETLSGYSLHSMYGRCVDSWSRGERVLIDRTIYNPLQTNYKDEL